MDSQPQIGAPPRAARSPVPILIFLGLAVIVGIAWYVYSRKPQAPPAVPVLTDQARAYVRAGNLKLSGVAMGAKESFAQQTLVEITGNITNAGDRMVKQVEIQCVFQDPYGQVVWRERSAIVRAGLKPGETRSFRLAFDRLPSGWNQAMPQLVIAQILFG